MRCLLMLLLPAVLGLAGCAGRGPPFPSDAGIAPERFVAYMTPERSATLMTLPGDAAEEQSRYLSTPSASVESGPPAAVWRLR